MWKEDLLGRTETVPSVFVVRSGIGNDVKKLERPSRITRRYTKADKFERPNGTFLHSRSMGRSRLKADTGTHPWTLIGMILVNTARFKSECDGMPPATSSFRTFPHWRGFDTVKRLRLSGNRMINWFNHGDRYFCLAFVRPITFSSSSQ